MTDFLLELFSEEIPARMQQDAVNDLMHLLEREALKYRFTLDAQNPVEPFVTPRRLALRATGLPDTLPDITEERKGPKTSAPDAALQGFLRSTGLTREQLEIRDLGKEQCYFAVLHKRGLPTKDALHLAVEAALAAFTWPKSMRWGDSDHRWVRPLHSILCLFGETIIPVSFAGRQAGNVTYGHRFLAPAPVQIATPGEYETRLRGAFAEPDFVRRRAAIATQADHAASKLNLRLKPDARLLDEVAGLVEWPTVLIGRIDDRFMDLPPEVLTSEMRAHQKYFALQPLDASADEKAIAPYFLFVSNMQAEDGGAAIVAGNERVLRARLADGRFFYDQDRKKKLEDWGSGLDKVTFHAKLGSIAAKVKRMAVLAQALAPVTGTSPDDAARAVRLAKADLTTGMVGEFPELQGVMGRYYALAQGEHAHIADAVRDHYLPLGPDSEVPTEPVAVTVALADKFDTLVSLFCAGEKPTGSKDPFALRRAALGILRIIIENSLRLPLASIITPYMESLENTVGTFQPSENLNRTNRALEQAGSAQRVGIETTLIIPNSSPEELLAFFADRLKIMLKDAGLRHDCITAITAQGDDDLFRVQTRAHALQAFLATVDGANLLAAYKRAGNILAIEEKKDGARYEGTTIDAALLQAPEEQALHDALQERAATLKSALANERFEEAMRLLAQLRAAIDPFFAHILINAPEPELRRNRLELLALLRSLMDRVADFSRIEG